MSKHFADRMFTAVRAKESAVVVGMDPDLSLIPSMYFPKHFPTGKTREGIARGVLHFCTDIIEAVADVAVAIKPQLAYFERLGPPGLLAYEEVVKAAQAHDILVIADGKRNDIASTARQYASAYLGLFPGEDTLFNPVDTEGPKADSLTINPYLGWDGVQPFIDPSGEKGLFLLVKTSNPSSGQLQDLYVADETGSFEHSRTVAATVAEWIEKFSKDNAGQLGYGTIGAVVGATYPGQLAALRNAMPHVPFLIPGYGAQGGSGQDVVGGFDAQGLGAVVNASRSILYAYKREGETDVAQAARKAAMHMRDDLRRAVWGNSRQS